VRCTRKGCNNTARLQADHRKQWRLTKHTRYDELDLLWYLWSGPLSPLFGKDRITTFERDFIADKHPTYAQFEQWVREQPGATIDKASIEKLNGAISSYNHDDATRGAILGAAYVPVDHQAPRDAVNLNNLDDWTEFHNAELK
jgi:hypothetical protein